MYQERPASRAARRARGAGAPVPARPWQPWAGDYRLCVPRLPRGQRGDAVPEVVEADAVVERRAVDDLPVAQSHGPRVGVAVGRADRRRPDTVPEDDDGVSVGDDA